MRSLLSVASDCMKKLIRAGSNVPRLEYHHILSTSVLRSSCSNTNSSDCLTPWMTGDCLLFFLPGYGRVYCLFLRMMSQCSILHQLPQRFRGSCTAHLPCHNNHCVSCWLLIFFYWLLIFYS